MSPTQRTLKYLRDLNYTCEVVERWNAHTKTRKDLFGFGDVIAVGNETTLLVQVTSGSNTAARIAKIKNECRENARNWLLAGNEIEVHGWRPLVAYKKDGTKAKRLKWTIKLSSVTLEDLA